MSDAGQSLKGDEIALHQSKFAKQWKRWCHSTGFPEKDKHSQSFSLQLPYHKLCIQGSISPTFSSDFFTQTRERFFGEWQTANRFGEWAQ
jgi:hypothetical protein